MRRKQKLLTILVTLLLVLSLLGTTMAAAEEASESEGTVPNTETFEFKMSDQDYGYKLDELDITDLFTVEAAGDGTANVTESGDAELNMFAQAYIPMDAAYDILDKSYTFQVDFYSTAASSGAIYVRAIDPQTYTVINPVWSAPQTFGFFEWDYYAEAGGSGASGTGGSGIKVYHTSDKIGVELKLYVEDGLNVVGKAVEFDAPEGFKPGSMNTYKIVDDGTSKVEIYVNDILVCTVEYGGEPAPYPDGDDGDVELLYYKNAVVKSADGTEVLSVDNARICAEYSTLAIGTRGLPSYFNNLILTYETDDSSKNEQPPATEQPDVTETEKPDVNTPAPATNTPSASTAAPNNSTQTADADSTDDGGAPIALIAGICAVVAVAAVVVIVVALKKKK